MQAHPLILMAVLSTTASALAAERWQEGTFPPPNGGLLVYAVLGDGNPACASYDGANCLWGMSRSQIDFSKIKPLVCGAGHRRLYGVTGFEDPKHWCNLALRERTAQQPAPPPAPAPATPPAGGYRLSDWSDWRRAAGLDYRYRVGWDPATGGAGKTVDAIYQVRNRGSQRWSGAVRSLACGQGTLWGSTDVELGPGQTREVKTRAPNCRSARDPDIRADVVKAGKFD